MVLSGRRHLVEQEEAQEGKYWMQFAVHCVASGRSSRRASQFFDSVFDESLAQVGPL